MKNSGFTLLEILLSISILVALSAIGFWYFTSATNNEALSKDRQKVVAILSEARSLSLSSKDASRYGVHIKIDRVILFKGNSYDSGNQSNISEELNSRVLISSYSITGGGSDIIFSRLTGETLTSGTIVLSLRNNSLSSTTVTVKNTGVIE